MATFRLSNAVDFTSAQPWFWTATRVTASTLTFESGVRKLVFTGSFTLDSHDDVTGTVTGASMSSGLGDLWQATGLSLDAAALVKAVDDDNNPQAFVQMLFGADDIVYGSDGNDVLQGYAGNDTLVAGPGDDTIVDGPGNDTVDGGSGMDTVRYAGKLADYRIDNSGSLVTVTALAGGATDKLINVERIVFDDTVAAPVEVHGISGMVFRLYRAVFDREPDLAGLAYWKGRMEQGVSLESVAGAFSMSSEYQKMYGSGLSSHELVARYYQNILHRAPDPAGLDFWAGALDHHAASAAQVLASISESRENVDLSVTLIGNGFLSMPPAGL